MFRTPAHPHENLIARIEAMLSVTDDVARIRETLIAEGEHPESDIYLCFMAAKRLYEIKAVSREIEAADRAEQDRRSAKYWVDDEPADPFTKEWEP